MLCLTVNAIARTGFGWKSDALDDLYGWKAEVAPVSPRSKPSLHGEGEYAVQGKRKFTVGMAIGVAAGMFLYRVLFG